VSTTERELDVACECGRWHWDPKRNLWFVPGTALLNGGWFWCRCGRKIGPGPVVGEKPDTRDAA
jgi:hypothetical protein